MIQITFQFSDVASAAALLAKLNGTEVGAMAFPVIVPPAAAPAPSPVVSAEEKAALLAAFPAPAEPPAPAEAPAPAPAVAYADLQKAVLRLYNVDRAAAAAIATDMGYATFKVIPAERWAEALAQVNAKISELGG